MAKQAPKVKIVSIEEFIEDDSNANKGTDRGNHMLEKSVSTLGAARSLVVDKDGRIVAGNKTREALVQAGFTEAIVIETDGKRPVIVKRKDWDLSDKKGDARQYAFFDNRVAEVDLDWDLKRMAQDLEDGVDLSALFSENELEIMLDVEDDDPPEEFGSFDEDLATEHQCPKCGYEWSGKSS